MYNIMLKQAHILKGLGHELKYSFAVLLSCMKKNLGLTKGRGGFVNFSDAPPSEKIFAIFAVNANPTELDYVIGVYDLNSFAFYWSGQKALASHWLEEFTNCTPEHWSIDQSFSV
jgi:hypothetical protein